jgi:RNA polymerase sigma factor (sigma-70 family)
LIIRYLYEKNIEVPRLQIFNPQLLTMDKNIRFSDPELVEAISEKNMLEQAIRQLYQDHGEITRSFIKGKGGTDQDADDIFQETIVAFVDSIQKGKFRQESGIRTFLISIAKNFWYNEIRKRQRALNREKLFELERDPEEMGISDVIQDREMKQQLSRLLQELGESCRKILELFYYENLSMKEIVSHLHYENEQVVRNKKYKCLQQLTDKLKQNPLAVEQITELISK